MGVIASAIQIWLFVLLWRPLPFRPRGFGAAAGRRAHEGCFQVLELERALEEREARLRQAEEGRAKPKDARRIAMQPGASGGAQERHCRP